MAAIAASLANRAIDEHAPVRIWKTTPLAPAPLFGSAGLVVNEHRDPFDLPQLTLHGVQIAAIMDFDPRGEAEAGIAPRLIRNHNHLASTFARHLTCDLRHG